MKRAALVLIVFWAGLSTIVLSGPSVKKNNNPASMPQALWEGNGVQINNSLGNTPQQNPVIFNAGDGGTFIVWEDGREGCIRLFAQKYDRSGTPLWVNGGVRVSSGNRSQTSARLADDFNGGIFIVWQDYRSDNADIYAQHLGAGGSPLWGKDGRPLCAAPFGQFAPEIATDPEGNLVAVWHDYRNGSGEDVFAQKINRSGLVQWTDNGLPVCEAPGTQWYPQIVSDSTGGFFVVWTDGRSGNNGTDIYGQHLSAEGQNLWEKGGIALCAAPNNQENPAIIASKNKFIVAWNDLRNNNKDLYVQKFDLNGLSLWEKDGVRVTNNQSLQENPKLAFDPAGGTIIVWTDNRGEESNIYSQRIGADGRPLWRENGIAISPGPVRQENPQIVFLSTLDWVVIWEDTRKGNPRLFGQKINSAGRPLWGGEGLKLSDSRGDQGKAAVAVAASNQIIVAYQDRQKGNFDLYAQSLSTDGLPLWGLGGLIVCNVPGLVAHQNAAAINNGQGEAIVVWEDGRNGRLNIYAQKITKTGQLAWGREGVPVAKILSEQTNPQLVSDSQGGALIVWEDNRNPNFTRIYAQRLTGNGRPLWGTGISLTKLDSQQKSPLVVADKEGGAFYVWEDERDPLNLKDVYAQRVSANGEILWDKNGTAVCVENGDQLEPSAVADGISGIIVTWADARRGDRNLDIYAQRLAGSGDRLWKENGAPVCSAPDIQRSPKAISDGAGGTVVAWTDKAGGSYDIYAQRLNKLGLPLWLNDGIPVCQQARSQQTPLLSAINEGTLLVWQDYRFGNWDLFANALSNQGSLLWGEEGTPIVMTPLTQYAPQVLALNRDTAILIWEDYRDGRQYEIFMQKIGGDGQPLWPINGLRIKTSDGARAPKVVGFDDYFLVIWEDYTGGGKAIYGQAFTEE
ncbi:MAG: hypothetical protein WCW67_00795 [Candidatus Margulisiibacteriota bacterium]|jgi:hypothetical protein